MAIKGYNAVMIFSATMAREREQLGDRISNWIKQTQPDIIDCVVKQSSDSQFHCITLVFFYRS